VIVAIIEAREPVEAVEEVDIDGYKAQDRSI